VVQAARLRETTSGQVGCLHHDSRSNNTAMKAVSILQPWAALVLAGAKRFETRGWHTTHRGPLAVHAGRRLSPAARALCRREPFASLLRRAGWPDPDALPLGAVLGTVELMACRRVEELGPDVLSEVERTLGDFSPGRWAWEMRDPRPLAVPVPTRGRLGIFPLTDSLLSAS
jgi:hypothetical protein